MKLKEFTLFSVFFDYITIPPNYHTSWIAKPENCKIKKKLGRAGLDRNKRWACVNAYTNFPF